MYDYERAILKTFSQIDGVSENLNSAVYKKAVCSFGDLRPAEKVADEVLQKVIKGAVLIELKEAVIKSVKRLKPYYSYLLSVHYGILDVEKPNELNKDRNYYRSLAYAVGKFSKEMEKEGYDKQTYETVCTYFPFIDYAYKRALSFNIKIATSSSYKADRSFKPNQSSKTKI